MAENENLAYKTGGKTFVDEENGHTIRVGYTLGATRMYQGGCEELLPTTWTHLSYRPRDGQDITDFIKRAGGSVEAYQAAKAEDPGIDNDIRNHGIEFANSTSVYPIESANAQTVRNLVEEKLGSKLSQETFDAIDTYITQETSIEARNQAEAAYKRTGGKGSSEVSR